MQKLGKKNNERKLYVSIFWRESSIITCTSLLQMANLHLHLSGNQGFPNAADRHGRQLQDYILGTTKRCRCLATWPSVVCVALSGNRVRQFFKTSTPTQQILHVCPVSW